MPPLKTARHQKSGDARPDPKALLARLQAKEAVQARRRGQFRIYLGAAPGVGKTFAMISEGQRRRARNTADVVIGIVETYGRPQTECAAEGLEVIPRRNMEMDTEAIIERRPSLVLVDELAHRNAAGSSRDHRWQDVLALLEAGISVVSTMNIWHLESMRDQCQKVSGISLTETVPDWVVDQADDIELIDMAPEALRSRVRHGNVYPPERAARELDGLFRPATLAALRELALRRTAQEVDDQLQRYMQAHDLSGWRVDERLLVCIDHRGVSQTLLDRARRMSLSLRCPIRAFCLCPSSLSNKQRESLGRNRAKAVELGCSVIDYEGGDPVEAIADFAAAERITQIIVAHPRQPSLQERLHGSLVRRLLRRLPDLDVHVVAEARSGENRAKTLATV
jgi:two-component system, OmpR family, sensor histidine kinase KdpD